MGKPIEVLYDSFELKIPKRECKDLRDSLQEGKKALVVKIKATHGGYTNGNKFNYDIESMSDAAKTWIEPYQKPVLTHHDELSDPIGRITDAEFIPMSTNRRDRPKGHILLTAKITDKESIEKILDGRYMTVSVGSSPASAKCNICDRDVVLNGLCDHKRGQLYDNKMCFWNIKVKKYNEVSFVNKPADEYQKGIESAEQVDSQDEEFIFDTDSHKAEFYLEDTIDSKENKMEQESKIDDLKLDQVDGTWTQEDLEMVKWLIDELEKDESLKDAKLSTEKRKSLSSSTFCGPNRSFPVNDCAHYTAAKRLIGRYKGPGDKSRILSCIERRGKTLGCTGNKDKEEIEIKQEDNLDELKTLQTKVTELETKNQTLDAEIKTLKDKADKVTGLENQLVSKTKEIETLNDQLIKFKADKHSILVDNVYTLRQKLGKNDVKDLKEEQIVKYKESLAKRSSESLSDSIVDLENEIKLASENKPNNPTEQVTKDSKDKPESQVKIKDKIENGTQIKDLVDILKEKKNK